MADAVGRERIQVLHGTVDRMITPPHADVLVRDLGGEGNGVTKVIFEDRGHVLLLEERAKLRELIANLVERAEGWDE